MQTQTKKVSVKGTKKATLKTTLINTKKGMALNVESSVKGSDIVKVKREMSALQVSKITANKLHKSYIGGFKFILDSFKDRGQTYLRELNSKYELNAKMEEITALRPTDLCKLMTTKESERQTKNGNLWAFWQVETLIARYLKASK